MKNETVIAIIVMTVLFVGEIFILSNQYNKKIDENTKMACMQGAMLAKEGFKDTKFKDFNFYESCLLNIRCIGVDKYCPKDEIKKEAIKFYEKN